MSKVKICGITNIYDALAAQKAGADFLGFIFAKSPRRIKPEKAKEIIDKLSPGIEIVALFVNEDKETVEKTIAKLGRVDILQFHGDETPDYCAQFTSKKVIKAFRMKDEISLKEISGFEHIDFILLDSFKDAQRGGTGKTFDWNLALNVKEHNIPIFLSGGLNPDNVGKAIMKVNPFAVDVSSGIEKEAGKKDHKLIRRFIDAAKI